MNAPGSIARRTFLTTLGSALGPLLLGCSSAPSSAPTTAASDAPPPLHVPALRGLVAFAGLRWILLTAPRAIAEIPWLVPPIARIAPEENLAHFAATLGFDLRQAREAIVAEIVEAGESATLYLVRHNVEPNAIERAFRARLVAGEHRAVDRADVIRISGKIGTKQVTLLLAGRDVAAFQVGGSATRGPARVASLYARDVLKRSPTAFADDPLRALDVRLGDAPFRAFAPGPFEGELARGARGLLAGATAIGAAVRPSAREALLVTIAVSGDFTKSAPAASEELVHAWNDLAQGSFGHLLGLDEPIEKPLPTHADEALAIAVEISPEKLAKGLASATSARLEEIMR